MSCYLGVFGRVRVNRGMGAGVRASAALAVAAG
jgi:hypothetical protein